MNHRSILIVVALVLTSSIGAAEDWPAFRGPNGDGMAATTAFPSKWSRTENVKWRFALPAKGNSSPIVSGGKVFITCAENEGATRHLYAVDRTTGAVVWTKTVTTEGGLPTHDTNPYCGSSPVTDGERVVVWHGSAGVYCYDFAGEELWNVDPGDVHHIWGYGSSPVIVGDQVVLNFGPGQESFLISLDLKTGETRWKTEEPVGTNDRPKAMVGSWSTPIVAMVDGQQQIVCSMATRVVGYSPADGAAIWSCGGLPSPRGDLVYTSPLLTDGFGVVMGGYKGPALGFVPGGEGDVTETNRKWHAENEQPQRIGSGVILGDHIFMANAGPGTIQCLDLMTGEERWKTRSSGNHWGSLILAGGLLYVTSQDGATHVFQPDPEKFDRVAKNELNEPSNSTPAFSDGEIFVRTFEAVYCIAGE